MAQQILTKTLLSKKPTPQNVLVGLTSYLVLLLIFVWNNQALTPNGYLVFEKGQYWKAFTGQLMHGDFVHLGHNTLFFTIFAILLNTYFRFWVFPVLTLLAGFLINLLTLAYYPPEVYLVGISGVIYFMAAFWMTMFVFLERHMSVSKRLITTTGVSLILFFPEVFEKNVSYLAHGLGFFLGIVFALMYFALNRNNLRSHEVWKEKVKHPMEDYYFEEPFEADFTVMPEQHEDQKHIH